VVEEALFTCKINDHFGVVRTCQFRPVLSAPERTGSKTAAKPQASMAADFTP